MDDLQNTYSTCTVTLFTVKWDPNSFGIEAGAYTGICPGDFENVGTWKHAGSVRFKFSYLVLYGAKSFKSIIFQWNLFTIVLKPAYSNKIFFLYTLKMQHEKHTI